MRPLGFSLPVSPAAGGDVVLPVLVGLVAGLLVGAVLAYSVMRRSRSAASATTMTAWRATEARSLAGRAVEAHRRESKVTIGVELASRVPGMAYEAADVRFLGHPAHLVVFDGHTDVKARVSEEIRQVVFLSAVAAASEGAGGRVEALEALDDAVLDDLRLVEECVAAGRVRWETYRA